MLRFSEVKLSLHPNSLMSFPWWVSVLCCLGIQAGWLVVLQPLMVGVSLNSSVNAHRSESSSFP